MPRRATRTQSPHTHLAHHVELLLRVVAPPERAELERRHVLEPVEADDEPARQARAERLLHILERRLELKVGAGKRLLCEEKRRRTKTTKTTMTTTTVVYGNRRVKERSHRLRQPTNRSLWRARRYMLVPGLAWRELDELLRRRVTTISRLYVSSDARTTRGREEEDGAGRTVVRSY